MNSKLPMISVIIPFYNRELYLAEAVESVLNQTYTNTELILVDDGSTDKSAAIARSYPVKYHYQTNKGIGAARNAGISLATGDFFAFLDSDDIWTRDKLAKQMAAFEANPNLEAVFGYAQNFFSPELDAEFRAKIRCDEQPISSNLSGAILIKRQAFLRIGMFDVNLKVGIDIDWAIRAMELKLQQIILPDVIYRRRIHKTNNGIVNRGYVGEQIQVLKAKLDRQRASQPLSST
ncbi:MAG: glycosyltransferase family A protein [Pseudanabaena sp. ELA645]|jgi:glycosyltransferase involved in cell wall biosynthesis